jgi:hypothetical protein
LVVGPVGKIHHPVDRSDDIRRILGDDDVREHEHALRAKHFCDSTEEIALAGSVEMVDGERGIDEVERSRRERFLEAGHAKIRLRK